MPARTILVDAAPANTVLKPRAPPVAIDGKYFQALTRRATAAPERITAAGAHVLMTARDDGAISFSICIPRSPATW